MRTLIGAASTCLALAIAAGASAAYPDRPITIVVPYNAGGPTDAMARILQGPLQEALGATVVVENIAGAGGAIGAQKVLRAPADGYTLFLGNNGPSAVTPLLGNAGFDPMHDFRPVSLIAKSTMVLAISGKTPAKDLPTFIDYAKRNPGKLNYASAGTGSLGHLASALLVKQAGLDMMHIPYKGQAPTLNALVAGEVDLLLTTPTAAMRGQAQEGRIRFIGVTSEDTSPFDPQVQTIRETIPDFVLYSWFALMGKEGTPDAIVQELHDAVAQAIAKPEVRERFAALGVVAESSTAETVSRLIGQDVSRWSEVIRENGIKAN